MVSFSLVDYQPNFFSETYFSRSKIAIGNNFSKEKSRISITKRSSEKNLEKSLECIRSSSAFCKFNGVLISTGVKLWGILNFEQGDSLMKLH